MGGGGWKRDALDSNKERLVRKKGLWFAEKNSFSAHTKQLDKEKTFSQRTTTPTSHCTKANAQQPFSNIACYCELAVQQFFFEKYQSCVCTTVTLSHRFKAFSPAFCGKNRFRLVLPEISAKLLPAEL